MLPSLKKSINKTEYSDSPRHRAFICSLKSWREKPGARGSAFLFFVFLLGWGRGVSEVNFFSVDSYILDSELLFLSQLFKIVLEA